MGSQASPDHDDVHSEVYDFEEILPTKQEIEKEQAESIKGAEGMMHKVFIGANAARQATRDQVFENQCTTRQMNHRDVLKNSAHFIHSAAMEFHKTPERKDVSTMSGRTNREKILNNPVLLKAHLWNTLVGNDPEFDKKLALLFVRCNIRVGEDVVESYHSDPLASVKSNTGIESASHDRSQLQMPPLSGSLALANTPQQFDRSMVAYIEEAAREGKLATHPTLPLQLTSQEDLVDRKYFASILSERATKSTGSPHPYDWPEVEVQEENHEEGHHQGEHRRGERRQEEVRQAKTHQQKKSLIITLKTKTVAKPTSSQNQPTRMTTRSVPAKRPRSESINTSSDADELDPEKPKIKLTLTVQKFVDRLQDMHDKGESVLGELRCANCDKDPESPRATQCGHLYCLDCLSEWRKGVNDAKAVRQKKCVKDNCLRPDGDGKALGDSSIFPLATFQYLKKKYT